MSRKKYWTMCELYYSIVMCLRKRNERRLQIILRNPKAERNKPYSFSTFVTSLRSLKFSGIHFLNFFLRGYRRVRILAILTRSKPFSFRLRGQVCLHITKLWMSPSKWKIRRIEYSHKYTYMNRYLTPRRIQFCIWALLADTRRRVFEKTNDIKKI